MIPCKEIIELAREAQQETFDPGEGGLWFGMEAKDLERFARLIEQRLAGAVEPVAMLKAVRDELRKVRAHIDAVEKACEAQQPQPKQEPIGWAWQHDETGRTMCNLNDGINTPEDFKRANPRWNLIGPLYTAPQQREWVGLTDEEIFEIHKQVDSMQYLTFGKAISDKLRERNGGGA